MAQSRQGTFRAPETTVPRQGTFRLPESDPETTESEPEYKDAEEGPSRAGTHTSSSSPEPERVGQPLVEPDTEEGPSGARTQRRNSSPEPRQVENPFDKSEPDEPEPDTNEDLSASFTVKGWNPFEPRPQPFNPFHLYRSPTPPPLPPTPAPMTDVVMNDNDSKFKEVKLNPPKPFDGKRENLRKFVQDGELYLTINKKIYDDDLKKIGFFLSFMNEGDAASWKEQLLEDALATAQANNTELNLGSFAQFKHDLQEAFAPYDSPGDALEKMKTLRMKREDSIDKHIAKFRMMVSESKLDRSSPVIIDLFRETLSMPLQKHILTLESPPKKLEDWYDWATKLDHQWRRMMRIMGRTNANQGQGKAGPSNRRFFRREKDPNAMDIDSLSIDERNKLMKDGKCFICRQTGHMARDHKKNDFAQNQKKEDSPKYERVEAPKKKWEGNTLYAHVRSMIAELDTEEKEKFWEGAEDLGF